MDPAEYMKSLAELWGRGGKEFAALQQTMFFEMARRMANPTAKDVSSAPPINYFDPQDLTKANEAFAKMWAAANELSQTFMRNVQQGEKQDTLAMEMLGKVFDPRAWFAGTGGMDETLQKMAEGPRLADLWDTERKVLKLFNAWTALRKQSVEHNTVMLEAWLQAASKFAKDLNEKADRKEALGSWRDVLALWVETANTTLLETQRSIRISRASAKSSRPALTCASRSRSWRLSTARCLAIRRGRNSTTCIAPLPSCDASCARSSALAAVPQKKVL